MVQATASPTAEPVAGARVASVFALPAGKTFKKTNLLIITKDHVKLWAVNRSATIFGAIGN